MSRAFVKEDDSAQRGDELPERPQSPYANYVTPQGLAQLRAQYQALADRRKALAENKDDALAPQQLREVERDLRYFQARVESAIVVDPANQPADEVHFGARVEVRDGSGARQQFTIVGEDEADAPGGKVSWASPLAKAMLGARVGDTVVWKRPAGDSELEIVAIHKAKVKKSGA